jgi:hypothetical protein
MGTPPGRLRADIYADEGTLHGRGKRDRVKCAGSRRSAPMPRPIFRNLRSGSLPEAAKNLTGEAYATQGKRGGYNCNYAEE